MYARQSGSGLIILEKTRAAPITKSHAYCLLVELPTRRHFRSGICVGEIARHWERVTHQGRVVRCHTLLEAQEAAQVLEGGLEQGQWIQIKAEPYSPSGNDIPYHEWVKGISADLARRLGMQVTELPEAQDPSLRTMSDKEWLARGPR